MRLTVVVFCALALGACRPQAPAGGSGSTSVPALETRLPDGSTLSYVRTNQDGTLPERIYIRIVSQGELHVTKMVRPCTDAAYVTAVFDPASGEATRLVGGRLQPDGTQLAQAFLSLDSVRRTIEVRLGDAAAPPAESHIAPPAPWRMYDFDFAEFALFGPRAAKDFSFGLALAWPDGSSPLVRNLGEAKATFVGTETRGGKTANRFRLAGAAFNDLTSGRGGGEALFDASQGYLLEANLSRPNHTPYKDLRIVLESVGDAQAWADAIAEHWRAC